MGVALQCPECGFKHRLDAVGDRVGLRCAAVRPGAQGARGSTAPTRRRRRTARVLRATARHRHGTGTAAARTRTAGAARPKHRVGAEPMRLPVRILLWVVAFVLGALVVRFLAKGTGFAGGDTFFDLLIDSSFGTYLRLFALVPVWALFATLVRDRVHRRSARMGPAHVRCVVGAVRHRGRGPAAEGPRQQRRGRCRSTGAGAAGAAAAGAAAGAAAAAGTARPGAVDPASGARAGGGTRAEVPELALGHAEPTTGGTGGEPDVDDAARGRRGHGRCDDRSRCPRRCERRSRRRLHRPGRGRSAPPSDPAARRRLVAGERTRTR